MDKVKQMGPTLRSRGRAISYRYTSCNTVRYADRVDTSIAIGCGTAPRIYNTFLPTISDPSYDEQAKASRHVICQKAQGDVVERAFLGESWTLAANREPEPD
ncbi:hypothetical protein RvY_06246 [Ramazzottius varieornatus]|uniref:Uncharacterized protein n=1 Tax=Ramazzottius varieornatus TaxID=947166 RepID=A0A1D1V1F3_RAMVA|nr:hypothetical protein RvY_06246 [Ramazzottius varieornatus]